MAMATDISSAAPLSTFARAAFTKRPTGGDGVSSPVIGLPHQIIGRRRGRVRCSSWAATGGGAASTGASLLVAASVMTVSSPALALLVDERMSTAGAGLSSGISNNPLGWILVGIFGLIWSLYFVYTSALEEDEQSGLSL